MINNYFGDTDLHLAVEMNHAAYHETLLHIKERCDTPQVASYFFQRRMSVDVNRCVLNFLSSVRMFLDHKETELKRLGEVGTQRLANFKRITNQAFDNDFSYRFLYKLRNYVQHCGVPMGRFGYSECLEDDTVTRELVVNFDRDILLQNFDWGKVGPDLQSQPEGFSITSHVDWVMEWVGVIQNVLSSDLMSGLAAAVADIEEFMKPTEGRYGTPFIGIQRFVEGEEGKSTMMMTDLPLEQMQILKETVLRLRSR